MWGSNMVLDLGVYLRLGPLRVVVPIQVRARGRGAGRPRAGGQEHRPCLPGGRGAGRGARGGLPPRIAAHSQPQRNPKPPRNRPPKGV
jgi:hypothetical protein